MRNCGCALHLNDRKSHNGHCLVSASTISCGRISRLTASRLINKSEAASHYLQLDIFRRDSVSLAFNIEMPDTKRTYLPYPRGEDPDKLRLGSLVLDPFNPTVGKSSNRFKFMKK